MGIELAIGAALAGTIAGSTLTLAGGLALGFSFQAALASLALGALQSALTPKPKAGNFSSSTLSQGVTQNVRQAITPRRIVYGEVRVGGALVFVETTENNKYLHMVLLLADHRCQEIGEVWFDDEPIPPDYINGSGMVTQGRFANKARIKKYLGAPGQTADSDLVTETSVTSNFIGNEMTYMYIRLEHDRDIFPSKIPNFTAFIKGRLCYDIRDTTTKYTANTVMFAYDYMTLAIDKFTPGCAISAADIDSSSCTASLNSAEEMVTTQTIDDAVTSVDTTLNLLTLTGVNERLKFQTGDRVTVVGGVAPGGLTLATNYFVVPYQRKANDGSGPRVGLATTLQNALNGTLIDITSAGSGSRVLRKNAEPRYFGGGIIESSDDPKPNIEALLSGCGGSVVFIGGKWFIHAAFYRTPVFSFSESHIIGKYNVRPKVSRRDRFNLVKGVYVSPFNDGEATDYPPVTNSTYVTEDNGRKLPIDYDLPMTQRPHTAQRLAKIKLEKHRQEAFFEAKFMLHAMQVQPADNLFLSNTILGYSSKVFEVITWSLDNQTDNNAPLFFIKMALQETASAVYDWNSGEETSVDPAPNTSLPNPLVVGAPVGLAVVPFEIRTAGGDFTYEFEISWTPPIDIFVVNGGHYDVEFKQSTEIEWSRSFRAEDSDTAITVKQVEPGVSYDCRMRSVNNIGVRSAYASLFGFTVSSPSGATIRIDEGLITQAVHETVDMGLITDAVDVSDDEGSL